MYKLLVGVTGSPGGGKTTVCNLLRDKGALVIDVDEAGRRVVDDSAALRQCLRTTFSDEFFFANGRLDRSKLGAMVFADHNSLLKLNQVVHPFMINRVRQMINSVLQDKLSLPYLVIDMALLFELHMHTEMDFIVTVTAPQGKRLERLIKSRGFTRERADQMNRAQLPQQEKAERADYVLANDVNMRLLQSRVDVLHRELLRRTNLSDI